jgi:membrane protease YdiL (CAAX protease family)
MKKENLLKIVAVAVLAVAGWLLAVFISELFAENSVWGHLSFGLIVSAVALTLVSVFYRLDNKQKKISLNLSKHLKPFGTGFLWFAAPATVLLLGAVGSGIVEIEILRSPIEVVGIVLLIAGLVALAEAIPEEIIMRGYIFSKLSESGKRWFTIFAQAVIFTGFAFAIGALSDPLDASFIFTFGMVLGILRSATGSVAAPVGFHLACMTFQQSFTERWEIFAVSNEAVLQMYIFGMIPLSIVSAFFVTKMLNSKT